MNTESTVKIEQTGGLPVILKVLSELNLVLVLYDIGVKVEPGFCSGERVNEGFVLHRYASPRYK